MDWLTQKETLLQGLKKYRYGVVVLLIGVLLMTLPQKEEEPIIKATETRQEESSLQDSLSRILSQVEGAGRVEVLLTEKAGEEILYQTDDDQSQSADSRDQRRQTVLIETSDRQKSGLIRQINPPVFLGAVVLSQGADSASVRLSLVEAVMGATGLPSHSITVLKMK